MPESAASSSSIDLLWAVVIGTGALVALATALIASLYISQRRYMAAQHEKMLVLKESESRFRNLVENIKDIYYVTDARGRLTYASPNLFRASGYSEHEMLGRLYTRLIAREDRRRVVNHFLRAVANGTLDTSCEFRARLKDGTPMWVEQVTRILRDESGTASGFRNIVRDISERKHAEEMRAHLTKRIIEAQESERKRIARDLHDGVGQLLTAVKYRLHNVLAKSSPAGTPRRTMSEIDTHLEMTIQEIRRISHNLRPSALDDLGLLSAVRALCDEFMMRTGIPIDLQLPVAIHRFSSEIELALFRIIQEALNNAEKHSGASLLMIRLELNNSLLDVAVRDNGKGFDIENLRTRVHTKRGIGLESIRERVVAIGGTAQISSTPGNGTEILLQIPLGTISGPNNQQSQHPMQGMAS